MLKHKPYTFESVFRKMNTTLNLGASGVGIYLTLFLMQPMLHLSTALYVTFSAFSLIMGAYGLTLHFRTQKIYDTMLKEYASQMTQKIESYNNSYQPDSYQAEQSGLVFSREADVLDMLESLNNKEKNA